MYIYMCTHTHTHTHPIFKKVATRSTWLIVGFVSHPLSEGAWESGRNHGIKTGANGAEERAESHGGALSAAKVSFL